MNAFLCRSRYIYVVEEGLREGDNLDRMVGRFARLFSDVQITIFVGSSCTVKYRSNKCVSKNIILSASLIFLLRNHI